MSVEGHWTPLDGWEPYSCIALRGEVLYKKSMDLRMNS